MTIAEQLVAATTPGKKAAVTKRIQKAMAEGALEGKNPVMIRAGFLAAATKIRNA